MSTLERQRNLWPKKKRVKTNAAKTSINKPQKKTASVIYTVNSALESWGETTEYGKSFRSLEKDMQSAEVALLNKGSAKSMKNIVKAKLIHDHYSKIVDEKLRAYLSEGCMKTASMFHFAPKYSKSAMANLKFLSVGEWVEVDGDRSPGFNSEGGIGVITSVHDDFADIKYVCTPCFRAFLKHEITALFHM